jgi:hypothetical protein
MHLRSVAADLGIACAPAARRSGCCRQEAALRRRLDLSRFEELQSVRSFNEFLPAVRRCSPAGIVTATGYLTGREEGRACDLMTEALAAGRLLKKTV